MATAEKTSTTPSQPSSPRMRFTMSQPRQRSESTDLAVRNRPKVMKLR